MRTILLDLWPVVVLVALLGLEYLIINAFVCKKMTRTWNVFRFTFGHRYWCMSVLNYNYLLSRQKGESIDTFIIAFTGKYLMTHRKNVIFRLREKERKLLIEVLSDRDFITSNFGEQTYSMDYHRSVLEHLDKLDRRSGYGK